MALPSTRWILLPLLLAGIVSIGVLVFSELSHDRLYEAGAYARRSLDMQDLTREVQTLVLDAETGQRGYLLTGRSEYLEPYTLAVQKLDERMRRMRALPLDGEQLQRVHAINVLVRQRMDDIDQTLTLYKQGGVAAAGELMRTDAGKNAMDELRAETEAFDAYQQARAGALWTLWEQDILYSRFGMALSSAFNIVLLVAVYVLATRDTRRREEASRQLLEHKQSLEQTVRERTAELSRAYRHLQTIQETEKFKLARDIHDELGAILVSAKMDTSWVQQRLGAQEPALNEKLRRIADTLDDGVQIKRRIIEELRPTLLDNLGLGAAIEWQASEVCGRSRLTPHVRIPDEEPVWPNEVAIALFRIVQEALTNIVRYAQARNVWVELSLPADGVRLQVRDDGIGFKPEATPDRLSHGILGMRERVMGLGGVFRIGAHPDRGTIVDVFVPVVHSSAVTGEKGAVVLASA